MAKIRRYKLSWEASDSKDVAGYKVYWSEGKAVSYDSQCIDVINLTEIILPDDVPHSNCPLFFGVSAIDKNGNESDITKITDSYQFKVPKNPVGLSLKPLDEYQLVDATEPNANQFKNVDNIVSDQDDNDDPLADAIESGG